MSTDPQTQSPNQSNPELPAAGSALSTFRRQRQKIAAAKTLTLVVPGYEGLVGIRYKALDQAEYEGLTEKMADASSNSAEAGAMSSANADLLIKACEDIVVRQTTDSDWEPLVPGKRTTFANDNFDELLGVETSSAREAVAAIFSPEDAQIMAPSVHGLAVTNWLRGSSNEIDKELLGE